MNLRSWAIALIGVCLGAGGCRTASAPPSEPAPPATAPQPMPTATPEPQSVSSLVSQMDFWLSLFVPPSDGSEGEAVFSASGYSVARREYDFGYAQFLAGRGATAELEREWQEKLRRDFLVLRWLEENRTAADESFRLRSRLAIREEIAKLAYDSRVGREVIPEAAILAAYEARKAEFFTPERVHVRIVQVRGEEEARGLLTQARGGTSVSALAREASVHRSRAADGELEPFARGEYTAPFEELAFRLQPGDTDIVETPAGWFLMQKIANLPAATQPLERVRERILRDLQRQKLEESLSATKPE